MAAANAFNVHDVLVKETSTLTLRGQPVRQTVLTYYVGDHGPFTFIWPQDQWTPAKQKEVIESKVRDIRAATEPYTA
jgi:hypothetical protein